MLRAIFSHLPARSANASCGPIPLARNLPLLELSRGARMKSKVRKAPRTFDLGWDQLRADLERVPLPLEGVSKLEVSLSSSGRVGFSGGRFFVRKQIPRIKYQNPDLEVTCKTGQSGNKMRLEKADGSRAEIEMYRLACTDIARELLKANDAGDDVVEQAVAAITAEREEELAADAALRAERAANHGYRKGFQWRISKMHMKPKPVA
mmetsp:Transcript_30407/g.66678  ORF Transcript_30407/g.66678 Transcript_30407/m.66678 type:complete len:207 (+) Transcript_30407:225-845(+)